MTDSEVSRMKELIAVGYEQLDAQLRVLNLSIGAVVAGQHGTELSMDREELVYLNLLWAADDLTRKNRQPAARAVVETLLGCRISTEQRSELIARLSRVSAETADFEAARDYFSSARDEHEEALELARDVCAHNVSRASTKMPMSGASFKSLFWSGSLLRLLVESFDAEEWKKVRDGFAAFIASLRSVDVFEDFAMRLFEAKQHTGACAIAALAVDTLPDEKRCRELRGMLALLTGLADARTTLEDLPLVRDCLSEGHPLRAQAEELMQRVGRPVATA